MSKFNAAFWKWFGDSKVVDNNGEPLVVYHGTSKKFRKFSTKKSISGIIWFSTDRDKIERGDSGAEGRSITLDLYASIQRPAGWKEYDKLLLIQLRRDFDGAILSSGDGHFDGFVFDPNQLKSASKNDGTWDTDDASIRSNPEEDFGESEDIMSDEWMERLEKAIEKSVAKILNDAGDAYVVHLKRKDGSQLFLSQTANSGKNAWQVSWVDKNDIPSMDTLFKSREQALISIAGGGPSPSIGQPGEWKVVETRKRR